MSEVYNEIYKIKSNEVKVLQKGKDFTEEHYKIIFNDGTSIYKVQLNEILVVPKEKYVMYSICKDAIYELQRELRYLDEGGA